MMKKIIICAWFLTFVDGLSTVGEILHLSIVHVNDFHASFEETNKWGKPCKNQEECIGGFTRMYQTIMSLKKNNPNALILNAGDNFQGTIWNSVFGKNVTLHFMNKIPFDAVTLGNHEFDDAVNGAVDFIKLSTAPIVLANINDTLEPEFQTTYKKSIVVERNGRKIGIIGVLLTETKEKSQVGKLIFLDESESINREAERLVNEENVFTNIVVSHSGYILELEMARKATGRISVIVGGHTHSFLWSGVDIPSDAEKPEGPYPTVVERRDGKKVLVVQALSTARYVGNLIVSYDKNGNVVNWSGKPIFQEASLPQNKEMNEEIAIWKSRLDAAVDKIVGETFTELSSKDCQRKECSLGNFVADAMVFDELQNGKKSWNYSPLAILNCGSLKETIPKGNITFRQLLAALPFKNNIVAGFIEGKFLLDALEHALHYFAQWQSRLLQVSGIKITYNMSMPEGKRLIQAQARCANCEVPHYTDILPKTQYNIVLQHFIAQGGDGFVMFRDNLNITRRGRSEIDVLMEFLSRKSPVWEEQCDRITILGDENIQSLYRK